MAFYSLHVKREWTFANCKRETFFLFPPFSFFLSFIYIYIKEFQFQACVKLSSRIIHRNHFIFRNVLCKEKNLLRCTTKFKTVWKRTRDTTHYYLKNQKENTIFERLTSTCVIRWIRTTSINYSSQQCLESHNPRNMILRRSNVAPSKNRARCTVSCHLETQSSIVVPRRARGLNVPRRRDAQKKRFGTGSAKSSVLGCARRTPRTIRFSRRKRCRRSQERRRWRRGRRRKRRWRRRRENSKEGRGARERRFKGKKKEVAFKKKKKEHGEPVAASIRQLGAQLQPGAVTSTELHGKPSQFASNNGVMPRVVFIGDLTHFYRFSNHTDVSSYLFFEWHTHIDIPASFFQSRDNDVLRKRGHWLLYRWSKVPDRLTVQRHSSLPLHGKRVSI